jgi:outer membrane protein W
VTRNEQLVGHYPGGDMVSLGNWQDRESNSSFRLGAALEAGVSVKLSESWFAGISAGCEWIDDTSVTVGPNKVDIDLSGFTASFMIGVRF